MPSELEAQKARKDALLKMAISAHNEGVQEFKRDRRNARIEMQGLIREQRGAHARWQKEQQRQADEGGWLAGAMQGGAAGMSIGTAVKPGLGTLIGGLGGFLAGGIYGGTQGRQAVQEMSPYVGAVSQIAGGYAGMQASEKQNKAMMDFYKGQDMRPGATSRGMGSWGAEPMNLGGYGSQLELGTGFTNLGDIQAEFAAGRKDTFTPPAPPAPPPPPTSAVDKWGWPLMGVQ